MDTSGASHHSFSVEFVLLEDVALLGRVSGDGFKALLSVAASILSTGGLFALFLFVKTDVEDDLSTSSGEAVSCDANCSTVGPAAFWITPNNLAGVI